MMAPGRAKTGPTSPKMAQDSPKMAPRCAQVALRCPSCPEDGAKKPFLEDVSSENAIYEALEALKKAKTRIFPTCFAFLGPFFEDVPSENAMFEALQALNINLS